MSRRKQASCRGSLALIGDEIAQGTVIQPFEATLGGYPNDFVYLLATEQSQRITALRTRIRRALDAHSVRANSFTLEQALCARRDA